MKYYAKTNTADPRVGFLSVGCVLTEEEAGKLGEEKIRELVARGVLAACGEEEPQEEAPKPEPAKAPEPEPEPEMEPETEPETESESDEPMELPMGDDIVGDGTPKKGGRRKKK